MTLHLSEEFWSGRDELKHIRDTARALGVGPESLLGNCLIRAVATIPPNIALPAIVGSRASLNMGIATVGRSGEGKGISTDCSRSTFRWPHVEEVPLGSGEGIARTFRPAGTKPEEPNTVISAILAAPEVDTIAALASRQGSTLTAELRKLWSGETLGFGNAGKETRCVVPAHTYRASFVLGVQDRRAGVLLDGADGGLPQRILWFPVADPGAPLDRPKLPEPRRLTPPRWEKSDAGNVDLIVPERAVNEIRKHRHAVLTAQPDINPLDGHLLLSRLKVAVGLMALAGQSVVSDEDWALAAEVIELSNATRERCVRAIAEKARAANVGKALAAAERDEAISDKLHQRCREGIMRALARIPDGKDIPANELRRSLKSDLRDCFDPAIVELLAENAIIAAQQGTGIRYRRSTVDHRSTPPELRKQGVDHRSTVDPNVTTRPNPTRPEHSSRQQTKPAPTAKPEDSFTPPTGPGRCGTCGHHLATQNHRPDCTTQQTSQEPVAEADTLELFNIEDIPTLTYH